MEDSTELILQTYLAEQIPLSAAIGVKVVSASPRKVVLSAPLSNNINHKKTAFGGSLHAVATLACWSLLHLNIGSSYQIVIANSETDFLSPVTTDFIAACTMPGEEEWARFCKTLQRRGKARLQLTANISCNTLSCNKQPAVVYSGQFFGLG
jgi:thioesterase domain-containing protein